MGTPATWRRAVRQFVCHLLAAFAAARAPVPAPPSPRRCSRPDGGRQVPALDAKLWTLRHQADPGAAKAGARCLTAEIALRCCRYSRTRALKVRAAHCGTGNWRQFSVSAQRWRSRPATHVRALCGVLHALGPAPAEAGHPTSRMHAPAPPVLRGCEWVLSLPARGLQEQRSQPPGGGVGHGSHLEMHAVTPVRAWRLRTCWLNRAGVLYQLGDARCNTQCARMQHTLGVSMQVMWCRQEHSRGHHS